MCVPGDNVEMDVESVSYTHLDDFQAGMGAEAIRTLLEKIDLEQLAAELKEELFTAAGQKRVRILKRLEVVEAFRASCLLYTSTGLFGAAEIAK